jgi:Phosphodiester glycosidase
MNAAPAPLGRRASIAAVVAAVGLLAAMPISGVARAVTRPPLHGDQGGGCPAAESLVPQTTWHKHVLAPGVVMTAGTASDSRGIVNMHVLRVNLASKNVSIRPLVHSIAERSPLSLLAKGHPHLVAATNTGYFDFRTGAPTNPVISAGLPLDLSSTHETVVGLGTNHRIEAGHVWWSATLTAGTRTRALVANNDPFPPSGIAFYNAKWGSAPVPAHWSSVARAVVKGVVSSVLRPSRGGLSVPGGGYLLVANGTSAEKWLSSLANGTKVSIASSVETGAAFPFLQAYGVGTKLVETRGVAISGLSCNTANTKQPARTAIGFTNAGRTLVLAIVADDPFTSMHGLDNDQMSELMMQLGVSTAYEFDGSGSTELLANLHGSSTLTLQNYPADGQERVMPLGLGISSTPVKVVKKKKKARR